MKRLLRRFAKRKDGNVAMIFAVSAVPLLAVVGAAVDYSSAANLQSQLQADTDAAALAACKSPLTATADLRNLARQVLSGFMPGRTVEILDPFTATNNPRSITLTTRVTYEPRFMKFAGTMPISTTATCAAGENFYEIALVLDTTGSMSQSAGSGTKIQALRTAATNFVNTMFTNFDTTHLKMSIVPFAASVKVNPDTYAPNNVPNAAWIDSSGGSSIHWQNVSNPSVSSFTSRFDIFKKLKTARSSWTWAGCFESLPYPYNTQDVTPSSGTPNTRYVPLFAPDEVGTQSTCSSRWGNYTCTDDGGTSPVNTYLDDGSSTSGTCNSLNGNKTTRMSQACKYVTPKNIDSSASGPNWGCTSRALTRLTNVKSALTTEIGNLAADGQTNIAEGLHWGWRTITKTGVFTEASDYGTPNTTKIIVLMTDGVNTWNHETDRGWYRTVYSVGNSEYSAYGYFTNTDGSTAAASRFPAGTTLASNTDARNAIDQLTRETCTNAKAKGIVIYSVAFSTPGDAIDASGQQLIKDCASSADKYFLASDAASLNSTFAAIAQGIGALRITK
ncbi:TadE/TadG family type IV pilus assembly protein [Enterovirga aerilata]|uniref:Pilus assembly protein n=1 Tax=Enterovirga aerilata TaxID=2730920 RepID=A0A849IBS0_9HYPH|nr:TadE/TadG family type IV pilus assembly protein [Enterovirga sp. DB1703]NNM71373.1 pilus assembly protein [Enterovirga sp. DB1703]